MVANGIVIKFYVTMGISSHLHRLLLLLVLLHLLHQRVMFGFVVADLRGSISPDIIDSGINTQSKQTRVT